MDDIDRTPVSKSVSRDGGEAVSRLTTMVP
jgi:hypothetical protein